MLAFTDGQAATETENTAFSFSGLWNDVVEFFTTKYWNVIMFFAITVIGIILIKTVLTLLRRAMSRGKMEKIAQSFIINILRYVLYLILLLILLSHIGVEITGIITALSAAVLAVGMALKDSIANLANGIIIVSMKMVRKGDFISVGGTDGTVDDINFLFTTVNTPDNKRIFIPNSKMTSDALVNYGMNGSRRVDFTFSVAYESDVELVKKIVTDVMKSCDKAATIPAPFCKLKTLGESSLDFFANCWCVSADYWDVYYYVNENVFNEFKKHGISVPYNQTEVRIRTDNVEMPVIKSELARSSPEFEIKSKAEKDEFEFLKRVKEKAEKKAKKSADKKSSEKLKK